MIILTSVLFIFIWVDPDPLHETDPDTDPGSKKLREIHIEINQNYKIAYHIREKNHFFIQCIIYNVYYYLIISISIHVSCIHELMLYVFLY